MPFSGRQSVKGILKKSINFSKVVAPNLVPKKSQFFGETKDRYPNEITDIMPNLK
jgi:hypothetical protein